MQAHYPFEFERDMACTAAELRAWLPGGSGGRALTWQAHGALIAIGSGSASVTWRALEPRRIASIVLPRLHVRFEARGIDEAAWQRFMKHFDLYTQRGGG